MHLPSQDDFSRLHTVATYKTTAFRQSISMGYDCFHTFFSIFTNFFECYMSHVQFNANHRINQHTLSRDFNLTNKLLLTNLLSEYVG